MKRLLVMALTVLVLLVPAVLAASDLSSMSVEELIMLRTQVEAELVARKEVKSFSVPQGTYVAGEDFPAGTYKVTLDGTPMLPMAALVVKDPEDAIGIGDMYSIAPSTGASEVGKLVLAEGFVIEVNGPNLLFTVYTGIGF